MIALTFIRDNLLAVTMVTVPLIFFGNMYLAKRKQDAQPQPQDNDNNDSGALVISTLETTDTVFPLSSQPLTKETQYIVAYALTDAPTRVDAMLQAMLHDVCTWPKENRNAALDLLDKLREQVPVPKPLPENTTTEQPTLADLAGRVAAMEGKQTL